MRIILYQIIAEPENRYLIFCDLHSIKEANGGRVPAEIYKAVFSGELDIKVPQNSKNNMDQELAGLERAYEIFNVSHPAGFQGRSMSTSDVVEIIRPGEESGFFFCDRFGFEEISFDKEKAKGSAYGAQKG